MAGAVRAIGVDSAVARSRGKFGSHLPHLPFVRARLYHQLGIKLSGANPVLRDTLATPGSRCTFR